MNRKEDRQVIVKGLVTGTFKGDSIEHTEELIGKGLRKATISYKELLKEGSDEE